MFLIRLLYAELDNYFLAKSLDEITSWNKQKLYLMKTNLQKVERVYPYNPHFKLLLNTVQKQWKIHLRLIYHKIQKTA